MTTTASQIGERLQQAREWRGGTTQEEMGQLIAAHGVEPVSRQAVQKWEGGETIPSVPKILAWCRVTDASPHWIVTGQGPERWSEMEEAGWLDGARSVAAAVYKALGDALGPGLAREAFRRSVSDSGEEHPGVDLHIEPNGDSR